MLDMRHLMWKFVLVFVVAQCEHESCCAEHQPGANPDSGPWTYGAQDSLAIEWDSNEDANDCLRGLQWTPDSFEVHVETAPDPAIDRIVRFPSAVPSGDDTNDRVVLEWSIPRNIEGQLAPAIVVVHESGSGMTVGKTFAQGLRNLGFHTFMIQLPYYGLRRSPELKRDEVNQIAAMRQAVADVRRARDAVAGLPGVDPNQIALQGTSLGSFVAATAASLDNAYQGVFLMLAGGDLYSIIQNGDKDAAKARERLARLGLEGETLRAAVRKVEPLRVAHRLDPDRVWLYTGMYDTVVPPENSHRLAHAIGLAEEHHIRMPANHYSGVAFLPLIFGHVQSHLRSPQSSD